jgi:hypothetical protein
VVFVAVLGFGICPAAALVGVVGPPLPVSTGSGGAAVTGAKRPLAALSAYGGS